MSSVDSPSSSADSDETGMLLDVLGDDVTRVILTLGKNGVVTIEQIVDVCDVSKATVYRRLRQLHDLGLVEKVNRFEAGTITKGAYRTTVDELTINVTNTDVTARRGTDNDLGEAIQTIRDSIDFDEVTYDPKTRRVQVSFTLEDDQSRTFLGLY